MPPTLSVVSLWSLDVPASLHFYQDILGLPLLDHPGHIPHLDAGGVTLVLLKGRPTPAQDAVLAEFPVIALEVRDLNLVIQSLQNHHIPLHGELVTKPQTRWIQCHDPGGNLIELVMFL